MRDVAFLNDCLVDGEVAVRRRRRSVRQRAVAVALCFEATIILGLALWPLLTPGTLPQSVLLARVPTRGVVTPLRPVRQATSSAQRQTAIPLPIFSPPQIPAHIARATTSVEVVNVPVIPGGAGMPGDIPGQPDGLMTGSSPALPPPARPAVRVIHRSEGVQQTQLISRVLPGYPEIARAARISGTVELIVLVGRDGHVISVQVLSGSPLLASAAKNAVEQWRYRPAVLDGQAVEVEARVTVKFVLD
jgi:periplasmic protein TonB